MATPKPPLQRRPHRVMVNVDGDTLAALDALAFSARLSRSAVAAEALQALVPMLRPVIDMIARARTAPAEALDMLSTHCEALAMQSQRLVDDIRREARRSSEPPVL